MILVAREVEANRFKGRRIRLGQLHHPEAPRANPLVVDLILILGVLLAEHLKTGGIHVATEGELTTHRSGKLVDIMSPFLINALTIKEDKFPDLYFVLEDKREIPVEVEWKTSKFDHAVKNGRPNPEFMDFVAQDGLVFVAIEEKNASLGSIKQVEFC